jgi:large subunit ribosomal protein L16
MLAPKRMKYRKKQRAIKTTLLGTAQRGNYVAYGDYGLASLASHWVTNRQLEAARIAMTRHIKRGGKVWIRVFPDMPFTKKPAETRMGKGKGSPEAWVCCIRPGMIMFEIGGVERELAEEAMRLATAKLPIKTKFVVREDME